MIMCVAYYRIFFIIKSTDRPDVISEGLEVTNMVLLIMIDL